MAEVTVKTFRRQLHILALLQNNKDWREWNHTSLSDLIDKEEIDPSDGNKERISSSAVKKCLNSLRNKDNLRISEGKGKRSISMEEEIPGDYLAELMKYYIPMVVTDITTESLIKRLIEKRGAECMWTIGSIYFASIHKKQIQFDYINNEGKKRKKIIFNPYHLVSKNHNIYLIGREVESDKKLADIVKNDNGQKQFILEKIENLEELESSFNDIIPEPTEYFRYSISPFMIFNPLILKIRYHQSIKQSIEQILMNIGEIKINHKSKPDKSDSVIATRECGDYTEAEFLIGDPEHLFKHLFFYGDKVEILKPDKFRNKMKKMLEESLKVYK